MKIYFACGGFGKRRRKLLKEKGLNILISYYSIIDLNSGFDAKVSFNEFIKEVEKNEKESKEVENLLNIQKH